MVVTDDDEVRSKISDTHDLIEKFLIANISNNSMKKIAKTFSFRINKNMESIQVSREVYGGYSNCGFYFRSQPIMVFLGSL